MSDVYRIQQKKHVLIISDGDLAAYTTGNSHGPNQKVYCLLWTDRAALSNLPDEWLSFNFQEELEKDWEVSRSRFLEWIYQLGETTISPGIPLKSFFQIDGAGISYWWSSKLVERFPLNSNSVLCTVFKVMTIERLIRANAITEIILCIQDRSLCRLLQSFCTNSELPYRLVNRGAGQGYSWKDRIPTWVNAFGWLILRWFPKWSIARIFRQPYQSRTGPEATIITYFPNIDNNLAKKGVFYSNYWGKLNGWLDIQHNLGVNWVLLFTENSKMTFIEACRLKNFFQTNGRQRRRLFLFEEFFTLGDFYKIAYRYFLLYYKGLSALKNNSVRKAFRMKDSVIDLFPIMHQEWRFSFQSSGAMQNLIKAITFERMVKDFKPQAWGSYSLEGQGWERILCHCWRSGKRHGPLLGYVHSNVRLLNLSLFSHPPAWLDQSPAATPLPDVMASNGPLGTRALLENGFPPDRLKEVEALRFYYLKSISKRKRPGSTKILLVAGDINPDATKAELITLFETVSRSKDRFGFERLLIKPHPFCRINSFLSEWSSKLKFEVISGSINLWLEISTHVLTCTDTSVAVEAYLLGCQVACFVTLDVLNTSPLLGVEGVRFIYDTAGLTSFLLQRPKCELGKNIFFNFDTPFQTILPGETYVSNVPTN